MYQRVFLALATTSILLLFSSQKSLASSCVPVFPATTCSTSDNVSITATVAETSVTFSGFAPGSSIVYFKEGDFIIGSTVTNIDGTFNKTITSSAATHTIQVYLIDTQGRTTPTITLPNFTLSSHNDLQINNINLPPTISVTKTKIQQGQLVSIFGQGSPGSRVDIYVNSVKKFATNIGTDSKWQFDFNGGGLADQNNFYAIGVRSGINDSAKSQTVSLEVLACLESDCNRVNPKPTTATPSATSSNEKTPISGKKIDYNLKIEIGPGLRNLILLISIIISLTISLFIFFILIWRRKRLKKKVLEQLEKAVENDIRTQNPIQNIRSDFEKAEEKIDG